MFCQLICRDAYKSIVEPILLKCGLEINTSAELKIIDKALIHTVNMSSLSIVIDCEALESAEKIIRGLTKVEAGISDFSGNHLIGKYKDNFAMIQFEDILYFSANSNDVYFHTDKTYHCKYKLYELEKGLSDRGFIRINKSEIVNIKQVSEIMPWFNSRYVLKLKDDKEVVVTKSYTKAFKSYIGL